MKTAKSDLLANRPVSVLESAIGQKVWVIYGEKPENNSRTECRLVGYYIPDEVSGDTDFDFEIKGATYKKVEDWEDNAAAFLNQYDWWADFLSQVGSFAFGFTELKPNLTNNRAVARFEMICP